MFNLKKFLSISFVFLLVVFLFLAFYSFKNITKEEEKNDISFERDINPIVSTEFRPVDSDDIIWGNLSAPVELIVYEDLSDIYSVDFNSSLESLKSEFQDDIVIAFRPYVNKAFQLSLPVTMLAQCAGQQNKFFQARDLILKKLEEGALSEDEFSNYAEELELDGDKLSLCLNNQELLSGLENLSRSAENFAVYGSPTTFVNNEIVIGARSFEDKINGQDEFLPGMKTIVSKYIDKDNNDDEMIVCTMDAKICPDGSYVGRDPKNNCSFFPCP